MHLNQQRIEKTPYTISDNPIYEQKIQREMTGNTAKC